MSLPLVDQADCYHTWIDETELCQQESRLHCIRCGLIVVAQPWHWGPVKAAPERRNPLKLSRTIGSSGAAGPA